MTDLWHSFLTNHDRTQITESIHFYDSLIIFERGVHKMPQPITIGNLSETPK